MKIKTLEELGAIMKKLDTVANKVQLLDSIAQVDNTQNQLQDLVFKLQSQANLVGGEIAPLIDRQRSKLRMMATSYVDQILNPKPDTPVTSDTPATPATQPDSEVVSEDNLEKATTMPPQESADAGADADELSTVDSKVGSKTELTADSKAAPKANSKSKRGSKPKSKKK